MTYRGTSPRLAGLRLATSNGEVVLPDVGPSDSLQSLREQIRSQLGVQPWHQLLSRGAMRLVPPRTAGSAWWKHTPLGDFGEISGLTLTDLSALHCCGGGVCRGSKEELRGITVLQLQQLVSFIDKNCHLWGERSPKRQFTASTMTTAAVVDWVVKPATVDLRCSLVELMTRGPAPWPRWFVSHCWGQPLEGLVHCLNQHQVVRRLSVQNTSSTTYWLCFCACRHGEDGKDPQVLSSMTSAWLAPLCRAVGRCQGLVLALDASGSALSRTWCLYEVSLALAQDLHRKNARAGCFSLDVAAVSPQSVEEPAGSCSQSLPKVQRPLAVVLTDGLTAAEQQAQDSLGPSSGWSLKAIRERSFFLRSLLGAMELDIYSAEAFDEPERRCLLNLLARRRTEEIRFPPLADSAAYMRLNSRLRAALALLVWPLAARARGSVPEPLARALRDCTRRCVCLDVATGRTDADRRLSDLALALPAGLQDLELHLAGSDLSDAGLCSLASALTKLPNLVRLHLNLWRCSHVGDFGLEAIANSVLSRGALKHLWLELGETCVSDTGLQRLAFSMANCTLHSLELGLAKASPGNMRACISDAGGCALAGALPPSLTSLHVNLVNTCVTRAITFAFARHLPECLSSFWLRLRGSFVGDLELGNETDLDAMRALQISLHPFADDLETQALHSRHRVPARPSSVPPPAVSLQETPVLALSCNGFQQRVAETSRNLACSSLEDASYAGLADAEGDHPVAVKIVGSQEELQPPGYRPTLPCFPQSSNFATALSPELLARSAAERFVETIIAFVVVSAAQGQARKERKEQRPCPRPPQFPRAGGASRPQSARADQQRRTGASARPASARPVSARTVASSQHQPPSRTQRPSSAPGARARPLSAGSFCIMAAEQSATCAERPLSASSAYMTARMAVAGITTEEWRPPFVPAERDLQRWFHSLKARSALSTPDRQKLDSQKTGTDVAQKLRELCSAMRQPQPSGLQSSCRDAAELFGPDESQNAASFSKSPRRREQAVPENYSWKTYLPCQESEVVCQLLPLAKGLGIPMQHLLLGWSTFESFNDGSGFLNHKQVMDAADELLVVTRCARENVLQVNALLQASCKASNEACVGLQEFFGLYSQALGLASDIFRAKRLLKREQQRGLKAAAVVQLKLYFDACDCAKAGSLDRDQFCQFLAKSLMLPELPESRAQQCWTSMACTDGATFFEVLTWWCRTFGGEVLPVFLDHSRTKYSRSIVESLPM